MRLAEIDFSKYRQLRDSRLTDGSGRVCFIGACALELGFRIEYCKILDNEGNVVPQKYLLGRFEEFAAEERPRVHYLWAATVVMNDQLDKSFDEIRKMLLGRVCN